MKTFKQFLKEAKQVSTLYHLTNLTGMFGILKTNSLKSRWYDNISFSRDKMLNYYKGTKIPLFKLIIDGDKLSNNYKIEPYLHHAKDIDYSKEREEIVPIKEITNISKYLKGIIFVYDNWKSYEQKFTDSEDRDIVVVEKNESFSKSNIISLLTKIENQFELYIQLGSQIKKDNKWFKDKGLLK